LNSYESTPKKTLRAEKLNQKKHTFLEPQTPSFKRIFGETTIFYKKIWNHPIEATIYKWLFRVPGCGCKILKKSVTPNLSVRLRSLRKCLATNTAVAASLSS